MNKPRTYLALAEFPNEQGILPSEEKALLAAHGPARRLLKLQLRRWARKRTQGQIEVAPVNEGDIPPGSLLSDQTLAAIQNGQMVMRTETRPLKGPAGLSMKQRKLQSRRARLQNLANQRAEAADPA